MKKIILLVILTSLTLSSCSKDEKTQEQKYYKTAFVSTWSIDEKNSFVWYTDSFNNLSLSAKVWWKIVSISKNVWDRVSAWEIIANLDSTEAKTWYSSSEEIISSLNALKSSTSEMYDSQIQVMQEKIKSAEKWVEIAKIQVTWSEAWTQDTKNINNSQINTIDAQIMQAQTWLETAKLQLENGKNTLNQKETDIYNNSKNAISNANIFANNLTDFLDNIYWVTDSNKYKNDGFEMNISAKNSTLKNQIETDFKAYLNNFEWLKNLSLNTNEDIKIALDKYNNFFSNDTRNILKLAYKTMENSISWNNFTDENISSYKTQISTFQTQNEWIILSVSGNYFLWLKWSIDNISSLEKEKKSTLDMLEKQVELAEKQIETLNQTKNQIFSAWAGLVTDISTKTQTSKKQLELSQNSLEEAKVWLKALEKQKESSLQEIETQISQVKSWKADASVMIQNWKVVSLIDWVVTKKLAEVWQVVWAGTPILIVSSDDKIKIEIQVTDEVLSKVNIWNKVQVEIEWISEMKIWELTKILPIRDEVTKKWSVEITLQNKWDVKIWSYVKIHFDIWENKENWKIIPNTAILWNMLVPWVYVLEKWKVVFKNITIIKQSDNFSEIEWLNIWDKIITDGKENIYDWEVLK